MPPIRFFCPRCNLMMKIGPKMFGRVVVCPQCAERIEVPYESDPRAEELYRFMKQKRAAEKEGRKDAIPESPVRQPSRILEQLDPDEIDRWIDEFWTSVEESDDLRRPRPGTSTSRNTAVESARIPQTRLSFLRPVAAAFVVGLVVGFTVHAIVVGNRETPAIVEATPKRITIEGELYYRDSEGTRIPDADAVTLFLPLDRVPVVPLSSLGLRPQDDSDFAGDSASQIDELGGVFQRTGASGTFSASFREPGRYLGLLISSHQKRTGTEIDPATLRELHRYFRDPEELIGEYSFSDEEYEFVEGVSFVRWTFGP